MLKMYANNNDSCFYFYLFIMGIHDL